MIIMHAIVESDRTPNEAHSVDAPIARPFYFVHHRRRATDAQC